MLLLLILSRVTITDSVTCHVLLLLILSGVIITDSFTCQQSGIVVKVGFILADVNVAIKSVKSPISTSDTTLRCEDVKDFRVVRLYSV